MPVARYLAIARQRWPLLAASSVLCGLLLGGLPFLSSETYQAESALHVTFANRAESNHVDTTPGASPSPTKQPGPTLPPEAPGRAAARRITTFTQLASTKGMAESVIAKLALPYSPQQLSQQIQATTPMGTNLITIVITDHDPARAAKIADAVAQELVHAGRESVTPPGELDAVVKVTRPAAVPVRPLPVRWQLPLVLGMLAGLAAGLAIALVRATDDTNVDEIIDQTTGRHRA
jgi:polysaccharide biosynthesis transport protein